MRGLRLHGTAAIAEVPEQAIQLTPAGREYFGDLVEPFGAKVDEDLLQRPGGHVSYTDLVERLVGEAPETAMDPDLVLLAYGLPDLSPAVSVAPYLNHLTGGRAIGFAVTEQGLGAPFTALRTAAAFARVGRCERFVLAAVEQARVPSRDPVVHDQRLHGSGVLLVFDVSPGPGVVEAVPAPVEPGGLWDKVAEAAGTEGRTLVVVGPWASRLEEPLEVAADVHPVGPGHYCTSVWLALAEHGARWTAEYDRLVLCDRDPRSGDGHLAVLGA
ncbi:hypothetical protein ABZ914_09225 [Spirillospora sp. NPDC046719]